MLLFVARHDSHPRVHDRTAVGAVTDWGVPPEKMVHVATERGGAMLGGG